MPRAHTDRQWVWIVGLLAALLLAVSPSVAGTQEVVGAEAADPLFDDFGDDLESQGQGFPDPFESVNRRTLAFNQVVDDWLLEPITHVYRFLVPDPGRRAVRRFLLNLDTPAILVNDVLQLEFHDAGVTTVRFLMNTTVGIGGLVDVGEMAGVPGHRSDFGQTLARAGVPSGPFLMLPVFGPTTMRDGTGTLVDVLFRPQTYFLGPVDQVFYTSIQGGSTGLARWDEEVDNLNRLEESSIDFYAALRSAYYQNRMAEIFARDESAPLALAGR